ncbi:MAG: MinD/ParA family protein [Candidatus Bathyarchaeota archaeon]|nr:MAG: MinD/ParA family protein [Candidatus Bathyarchaeota archaeon]
MGKIIAFHSYKGGTGKTLLSINLAATYAKNGNDVCLLDLDFRAPSLQARFKTKGNGYWLNDYLNGVCEIKNALIDLSHLHSGTGKFLVGLANPSTEAIREMSAKDRKWEMKALGRLLALRNSLLNDMHLNYLILDTSPGLQYSSINAIVAADVALVVTSLDTSDIIGTQRMVHELYDLFEKKTMIVVNKVLSDMLSSPAGNNNFSDYFHNTYDLPVLDSITCSCDVLRVGGTCVFTEEKQEHPFTNSLKRIAGKIEKL